MLTTAPEKALLNIGHGGGLYMSLADKRAIQRLG